MAMTMTNEKSLLIQLTGDTPLFKILDFLVDNKGVDFTKKDIATGAGISKASLFNHWSELEKYEVVKITRKFGKTKLYTLNSESPITKKILELESTLIKQEMIKVSHKANVVIEA